MSTSQTKTKTEALSERELQRAAQKEKDKNIGQRSFGEAAIRAVKGEGNERKFELSFSSEEPYQRWFGLEVLSHADSAVDLTRLNTMGVLLFNHDTNSVLGRVDRAWIEDKRGKAEVTFDDDAAAEVIYQKVRSGTLKGVSVRYSVDIWEEILPGKTSEDGYTGPCDIARKWTPLEVSIVSVPADATVGVGRSHDDEPEQKPTSLGAFEAQIQANKNYLL